MNYRKMTQLAASAMIISTWLVPSAPASASSASLTTQQAIEKYQKYYNDYQKEDLAYVQQYRTAYRDIKGSLADQIIERAIWYMDNGYMVYGHGWNSYQKEGIVDCSEFTKVVYGDFGFQLTDVARKYGSVGTRVTGVYPKKVNGKWTLQGTENLRPGDILTWWAKDANGQTYISHVAIYMGMLNGQPAVIGTRGQGNPTAIGIVNNFQYWWGEHFFSAQRVLPDGSWTPGKTIAGHQDRGPVIPERYVLPPQKPVVLPNGQTVTPAARPASGATQAAAPPSNNSKSVNSKSVGQSDPTGSTQDSAQNAKSGSSSSSSVWTTARSGEQLKILKNVYLRQESRLDSGKLGLLKAGSTVTVISQYNRYNYYVEDQEGRRGYITTSKRFVAPLGR